MFNKNTFLKVEFMPDGRKVFTSNFNKYTNPEVIANFINEFITRKELQEWLQNIYSICESKGIRNIGEEICEQVFVVQEEIEVRAKPHKGRNPIIKPSQVMKNFPFGEKDE